MDFYCRVKTKKEGLLPLEEVLPLSVCEDWLRENAWACKNGSACFPAFGANQTEYILTVDLASPSCKSLIRKSDKKIIFQGTITK